MNEASLIKALNIKEIVACAAVYDFNRTLWVFEEYMEGGSMVRIIAQGFSHYSEDFCRYTIFKVVTVLQELHQRNILQRDLRSCNVWCCSRGEVKISDVGASASLQDMAAYRKVKLSSPNWLAPEVIQGGQLYSKEVDVWSLGCFAYELATGKSLFAKVRDRV